MTVLTKMSGFGLMLFLALAATAQVQDESSPRAAAPAERFQAVRISDNRVFVIDTATGQCWSKYLGIRKWNDEGNPAQSRRRPLKNSDSEAAIEDSAQAPRLALGDDDSVELTIRQRERKAIPGSDGTLFIHLGDVTEGQVLVAVRDEAGNAVAGERSLTQGQVLRFTVAGQRFALAVDELRNLLTGDDFVVLRLSKATDDDEPQANEANPGIDTAEEPTVSEP